MARGAAMARGAGWDREARLAPRPAHDCAALPQRDLDALATPPLAPHPHARPLRAAVARLALPRVLAPAQRETRLAPAALPPTLLALARNLCAPTLLALARNLCGPVHVNVLELPLSGGLLARPPRILRAPPPRPADLGLPVPRLPRCEALRPHCCAHSSRVMLRSLFPPPLAPPGSPAAASPPLAVSSGHFSPARESISPAPAFATAPSASHSSEALLPTIVCGMVELDW